MHLPWKGPKSSPPAAASTEIQSLSSAPWLLEIRPCLSRGVPLMGPATPSPLSSSGNQRRHPAERRQAAHPPRPCPTIAIKITGTGKTRVRTPGGFSGENYSQDARFRPPVFTRHGAPPRPPPDPAGQGPNHPPGAAEGADSKQASGARRVFQFASTPDASDFSCRLRL